MQRFLLLLLAVLCVHASAQVLPARGLIVKLKPHAQSGRETPQAQRERVTAVAQDTGVVLRSQGPVGSGFHLLRPTIALHGEALDATVRRLRLHPDVEWVEPDVLVRRAATPNDPDYSARQWHLQAPSFYAAAINMPPAWDRTTGTAVNVAVLDTGIRPSHPELAGRLVTGYDFVSEVEFANDGTGRDADPADPGDWVTGAEASSPIFAGCFVENSSWHGTFIAGQIAAVANNGIGIAGINWAGKVMPVRVSGKCGAFLSDIFDGMRWAAGLTVDGVPLNLSPARIINLSFGGDLPCTPSYQDVINEVNAAGTLVVVAAGNESSAPRRPADCANVLAVGAVRSDGIKADYSNYGPTIALTAPGGTDAIDIYSLTNSGLHGPVSDSYGTKLGTSFSTPLAAGVASLMLSVNPALSPAQLLARMRAGTRPHVFSASFPSCSVGGLLCNCTTATCGAGLLDANGAVAEALKPAVLVSVPASASPGALVGLDGRASVAALGAALVSYEWTQLSGQAATIQNAGSAMASVLLPAAPGTFVFRLKVTDNAARFSQEDITVTTGVSSGGGSTSSGGGGSTGAWWGIGLWLLAAATVFQRRTSGRTGR